ncbi:MAG: hypothetical protein HYR55_15090 [Acidobacteria bacterium]|nr:hypothetical protein [Acidobacteriota bacterium]MBI3657664.1 hypothetical protein [Acidobacteriota bacterium]
MKRQRLVLVFSVSIMLVLSFGSVGAQTPRQVPQFDPGGSGSLVDSVITQNGDNVGIGTPLPQARLDVNGNIYSFNTGIGQEGPLVSAKAYVNFASDNNGSLLIGSNLYSDNRITGMTRLRIARDHSTMAGAGIIIPGNDQIRQGGIDFYTSPRAAVLADSFFDNPPSMVISSSGNVGIGTPLPQGPLQINSAATPPIGLPSGNNGLLLGSTGDLAHKWIQSYGGALSLNPLGNNVGIGTTNPTAKLDVDGDLKVSGNIYTRGGQLVGQQGPPGPQGPQGQQGPPVHTSAVCHSTPGAAQCGCNRVISAQRAAAMDGAGCSATSDTGSCSASSRSAGFIVSLCCVCAP